jgi:hypothetical protein
MKKKLANWVPQAAPAPPRESTTIVDTLDMAVVVHDMDRRREVAARTLREVGAEFLRIADRIDAEGLDVETDALGVRIGHHTLIEALNSFAALDAERRTLRNVLGLSNHDALHKKLEEHPQVIAALQKFPSRRRSKP